MMLLDVGARAAAPLQVVMVARAFCPALQQAVFVMSCSYSFRV
jgi:hypothetical protein